MKIIISNAAEAGMPGEMIGHCRQLLEWRIKKVYTFLPKAGDSINILYSEKDPLFEKDEQDDNAYFIFFAVEKVVVPDETDRDKATIYLELAY